MFSNILGGAAGFPVADLGDTVSQSLRFRGEGNHLNRTQTAGNRRTFTYSIWFKKTNSGGDPDNSGAGYFELLGEAGSNASNRTGMRLEDDVMKTYNVSGGSTNFLYEGTAMLRDPSSWYHFVWRWDTTQSASADRLRFYINGVQQTLTETTSFGQNSDTFVNADTVTFSIGDLPGGGARDQINGYVADVYMVDGQSLDATSFGRYQEDGVWVPKNYTGTYGTNGFHLDFADSSDLGNDVSGNNNDFSATGFDTADVALYSTDLFTESGTASPDFDSTDKTFASGGEAVNVFDGNSSNEAGTIYSPNTGTWVIFRPATAIVAQTSVKVRTRFCESIYVNETDTGLNATASSGLPGTLVDLSSALSFPITITNIAVRGNSSGGNASEGRITDIEIDGTILEDNTDNDVDYNDTPTSNYATYNPLVNNDEPTFNQANLNGDSFNNGIAWATQELPNKHLYCEFIRTAGDRFAAGVWDAEDRFEKGAANDNDYAFGIVYSEFQGNNNIYNESTTASQTGLTAYTTDDVLGVEWRGDLATRQVNFYINGTQVGTSENVAAGGRYYFGVDRAGGSTGPSVQVNFGQMPFLAAPSGVTNTANGMQTNNLPEPTIKNGKEYFETKLYSGTNNSNSITGLEFSPDLIWIKVRDASDNHVLVDTIRGTDSVLFSNSPDQQASSSSRFTSFDSNGFTVDTSDTAWNNSSNDYVAWCWKAGGTAVSNTDGTITSSVSANTEAGFSIVSYTGTGNNATVGHGLNNPPEFAIVKNREGGQNWAVGSDAIDSWGTVLYLNNDQAKEPTGGSTYWNNLAPTNSILNIGSAANTNSSNDMIAYLWHSVEGYSKFGKYAGNDNADGVFVYLGFRPAMIILKSIGLGYDWFIWDTARDTSNPSATVLKPDLTQDEAAAGSPATEIDILSNGFKIRGANQVNQLTDHLYAAWAESPFGGENAPPATAR